MGCLMFSGETCDGNVARRTATLTTRKSGAISVEPGGTKRQVPSCGTCGKWPRSAWGEVMARLLHEMLLLSCMAAFATAVVIAAASLLG
jgi:hypothetical protein